MQRPICDSVSNSAPFGTSVVYNQFRKTCFPVFWLEENAGRSNLFVRSCGCCFQVLRNSRTSRAIEQSLFDTPKNPTLMHYCLNFETNVFRQHRTGHARTRAAPATWGL